MSKNYWKSFLQSDVDNGTKFLQIYLKNDQRNQAEIFCCKFNMLLKVTCFGHKTKIFKKLSKKTWNNILKFFANISKTTSDIKMKLVVLSFQSNTTNKVGNISELI